MSAPGAYHPATPAWMESSPMMIPISSINVSFQVAAIMTSTGHAMQEIPPTKVPEIPEGPSLS